MAMDNPMKKFFLVSAVMLASCDASAASFIKDWDGKVTATFHGDPYFTAPERKAVERGFATWKKQTGGQVNMSIVWDLNPAKLPLTNSVVRFTTRQVQALGKDPLGVFAGLTIRRFEDDRAMFLLIPTTLQESYTTWTTTTMHELGHVLGLTHTEEPNSLMNDTIGDDTLPCLTKYDMIAFCKVNTCGFYALSPCAKGSTK